MVTTKRNMIVNINFREVTGINGLIEYCLREKRQNYILCID